MNPATAAPDVFVCECFVLWPAKFLDQQCWDLCGAAIIPGSFAATGPFPRHCYSSL